MKAENEIDKLFREGTQKEYSYDENLWSQVESELQTVSTSTKSNWRDVLKFLFVLVIILFLKTDSIVSFNQYVPSEIAEKADEGSELTVNSIGKLNVKEQSQANIESDAASKNVETPNQNNIQSLKNEKSHQQTSTKELQEKVETDESNTNNEAATVSEKSMLPEPDGNESEIITNNITSDELDENSPFNTTTTSIQQSLFSEFGSLNRMNSLDFLIELNNRQVLPKLADRDKLNELQQKFKKRDYLIEIEYGHSIMLNKNLSGLDEGLSEYRKQSENSRYAQSVGLNILTDIKRFTLGFGIHLSTYHEQLSYSYDEELNYINVSYDTSYTVVNGNYNSNGTPVILIRENINENRTEVTENVGRELVVNNYFKRISMPLSIGYTKTFGRFNAGLRTAVAFNYMYESTGGYISSNRDQFYSFEEKNQLQDWVIGNRNQLRLGYFLNEFVSVGASFNHEHDLSSFTRNYNSRFNAYGLGVWLLYRPR